MMKKTIYKIVFFAALLTLPTACHEYAEKHIEQGIYVNRSSLSMFVGEEVQLTASPVDGEGFQWTSNDEEVATVSNGKVTALKRGNTDIIATRGQAHFRVPVTVTERVDLKDIKLSASQLELVPGGSRTIQIELVPTNANSVALTDFSWWSDNEDIARASESGLITGIKEGTTTVHYRRGTIVKDIFVNVSLSFPFKGPHSLSAAQPLVLPFRDFDVGGEGYAFHDVDDSRTGDNYRANNGDSNSTRVDIEGGNNIGYTANGEWLLYTVEVKDEGFYELTFTAASPNGGKARFELDGKDLFGPVAIPGTGGWGNYQWLPKNTPLSVNMTKGLHKIKFVVDKDGFNIREMKFVFAD